jgi:hypothetical protein
MCYDWCDLGAVAHEMHESAHHIIEVLSLDDIGSGWKKLEQQFPVDVQIAAYTIANGWEFVPYPS